MSDTGDSRCEVEVLIADATGEYESCLRETLVDWQLPSVLVRSYIRLLDVCLIVFLLHSCTMCPVSDISRFNIGRTQI